MATGKSAEEFFIEKHSSIEQFANSILIDTRLMACGFDFKLDKDNTFICVEVKGINEDKGVILMTEKEFLVAGRLKEKFCLFVVKNFIDKPYHQMIFNPLESNIKFNLSTTTIVSNSYHATL